ncbi:MAG: sulfite dehydrogenase [Acidobacteria bacterium]|nr:sulfite dehydrogenase [Acidobacteriota bacterium]
MNAMEHGRRRFLKRGAALAGLAVGGIRSTSGQTTLASITPEVRPRDSFAYGERSRFENSVRTPRPGDSGPGSRWTPLQDLVGIITPSALHFITGTGQGSALPDIDIRQHRLLIHGLVDRPLMFALEELKRLPSVSRIHFLECASNSYLWLEDRKAETVQETHGRTSCSEWTGVPLSVLLKEAGVQKEASWLVAEGAETGKQTKSIPLEKAMEDVLVAYGQNGEALRPAQGYPLRLVVPGWEGINNVKWLRRIKVVDQPYMTRKESAQYANIGLDGKARWFQFQTGPKSVITFPSGGQRLPSRGFYEITGLAWSGAGAIRRVEVSTDGGRSWKDAELQEPVLRKAHTRFRFAWNWDGAEAVLQSRCTDELGTMQPTLAELSSFRGVTPNYWLSAKKAIHRFNAIQPWRITREGSVHNAMFS